MRSWATRCLHEASLWTHCVFVTLTYKDECLPPLGSLRFKDLQKFMKRLRRELRGVDAGPVGNYPIRFFACGEYGENGTQRPHYHLLLFNVWFEDMRPHTESLYTSATLQKLWPLGFSSIGEVTPKSVNYVAGYAQKKLYGAAKEHFLDVVDAGTGELLGQREPIFARMSLKPGLGMWWLEKYESDLKHGYVVVNGHEQGIPRYYMKKMSSQLKMKIEDERCVVKEYDSNMEPERLLVAEIVGTSRDMNKRKGVL